MKKILIVGGFGFLGSSIIEKLFNFYTVFCLCKKSTINRRIPDYILKNIKLFFIEENSLTDIFKNYNIDIVINCSVIYSGNETSVNNTNVKLPLDLIKNGRGFGCNSYIFFDTFFTKFPKYNVKKKYVNSKKELFKKLKNLRSTRIINLKLEHLFGKNDNINKFFPMIIENFKNNNSTINLSSGNQKRDFIYCESVIELIEEILIKINYFERRYYEIEVGTGNSYSIKNLVLLIKKILNNKKTILNFGSIIDNSTEIKNSKANLNSLPKFLNWNPKKNTLEENLKKLLYD